jgi:hypothetical protein
MSASADALKGAQNEKNDRIPVCPRPRGYSLAQLPGEGGYDLQSSGLPPHAELLHRPPVRLLVRNPWGRHSLVRRQRQRRLLRVYPLA